MTRSARPVRRRAANAGSPIGATEPRAEAINLPLTETLHDRTGIRENGLSQAAGSQGGFVVPTETTDFIEGASCALLFGLLSWAVIGAMLYRLISS
jgi:hypothetical protein